MTQPATSTPPETAPATPPKEEESLPLRESFRILFKASRAFWLVNLVNFGDGIAYFGILNLLTLYIHWDVGFSDRLTGIAVSVFTGLVTLFMFGGGFVSDRLGVRRALTLSMAVVLIGRILLVASPSAGGMAALVLWLGLIFMGVAEGVVQPALYAGVKEFTDPRTATIGYSFLYAIMNLGIAAEAFVSPYIRARFDISGVFWAMTAFTVVMIASNLLFFTKKIEDRDRVVAYETAVEDDHRSWKEKLKELPFLDMRFIFFIFILLPVRTLFAHQWLTLPDYVMRCFPENIGARYEWFQGLNPAIIVIFVPLIAMLTRKVNIITMMIIGSTISALTTFILVPGPHLWTLIFYVVMFSFGEAVWSSRFLEYVANLAPAGRVGAYMGLAGIPWFLAKATTGLYSGRMIEIFLPEHGVRDSGTMWMIYGFIAMISPIGLILGKRWVQKGSEARRMKASALKVALAYLTLCLVWGTTYLAIKVALEGFAPFFMVGVRFILAGLLLAPVMLRRTARLPKDLKEWAAIVATGILLLVGGNGLVTWSEMYLASGVTALTVATNPAWAMLIGGWLFSRDERYGKWAIVGMLLSMVGVLYLHHNRLSLGHHDLPGVIMACGSPICWATGSLIGRHYIRQTDVLSTTALQMLTASIPLLLLSTALGESWHVDLTARVVWALLFLIVIGSAFVYAVYVWLAQQVPISRVVTYTYVNPIVALILGRLILGESIEPHVVPATVLILGGLLIIYFFRPKPKM